MRRRKDRYLARDRTLIQVSGLFDKAFYLQANPDVATASVDPITHYVKHGWLEGRDPSPGFSTTRYLAAYPDVASRRRNPLAHFAEHGLAEGRAPLSSAGSPPTALETRMERLRECGLFDATYYAANNPDVVAAGLDPLFHFASSGGPEGRSPHPLFDSFYYRRQYSEVATDGAFPLLDYLDHGGAAGRNPHPDFDGAFYLARYPEVAAAGINPLIHYLRFGAREGRDPSRAFHTKYYLATNPDVVAAGMNPLIHYVTVGRAEGRRSHPAASLHKAVSGTAPVELLIGRYQEAGAVNAVALLGLTKDGLYPIRDAFLPHAPINAVVDPGLTARPTLRILCPSLQMRHATGGPNTIFIVGCALAAQGVRVSFLTTDVALEPDLRPIKAHIARLSGTDPDTAGVTLVDASDRNQPVAIGAGDVIMATAWWTAQPARDISKLTRNPRILYLIQDYETLFYGASEKYAQADETYSFDHVPIINTSLLRDHLVSLSVGRFADPQFGKRAFVFEPAIDADAFRPASVESGAPKRLLFYARPNTAMRNLFNLGVAALRAAVDAGVFRGHWEFLGMGEHFEPVPLGRGAVLKPAPWLDFSGYARQMAGSDLVLSLMLSPHPSYPPLEAAASGIYAVTTEFGVKTAERLVELSPNIIGTPPRVDALLTGLMRAAAAVDANRHVPRTNRLNMPSTWAESLAPILPGLLDMLRQHGCIRDACPVRLPPPLARVRTTPEIPKSPLFYSERLFSRAREYREGSTSSLLSLITTVYDTKASFLADLAHTVFGQDTTRPFEWVILDNGSSDPDTLACLAEIGRHPYVRLERVERNLGIVGGMRHCLRSARYRYVLPLDSDDLLFPDCLRTITAFVEQTGLPPAVYTNEDKTDGVDQLEPYIKPDWDPVLFIHSCYVAHLTVIDRALALDIGCYTDPKAEGCHDWDTFSRFLLAGMTPLHLPEVLYSWRIHHGSTSVNHGSKPYIKASHRFVLEKFLAARSMATTHKVVDAPLFGGTADYRFARRSPDIDNQLPELVIRSRVTTRDLLRFCEALSDDVEFIQLRSIECVDVAKTGIEEALSLSQAFPDTVMVGGRIHDGERIVESGYAFGYGGLIGCPDVGRPLADPGYFAQSWKPHSVAAVSARLAVLRRAFLLQALELFPAELDAAVLGIWLGFAARSFGGRVVFSPYLSAWTDTSAPTVDAAEASAITQRFGRYDHDRVGYAHFLDLTGLLPYDPSGISTTPIGLPPYAAYQAERIARRSADLSPIAPASAPTLSILTTVYVRTDVPLFEETAASILAQTHAVHEWVVLAHGPVSPLLDAALERLDLHPRTSILRLDRNLGIHGGLRHCLEHATGDFVASVDADDLLTSDAVATIVAAAGPGVEILYSDEDLLLEGKPAAPIYRPSYDPVLLRAHSTIWHLVAFRREIGLALGVYTSGDAEYAQDWDTVLRFEAAGHAPVHVPHVLYHWRQHASSISNSGSAFEGSGRSVQALLDGIRRTASRPDLLSVKTYPIDLGSATLYLERTHRDAPDVALLMLAGEPARIGTFPFAKLASTPPDRGPDGFGALKEAVNGLKTELVFLCGRAVHDIDEHGIWQAVKQLELVPDCMAVGGVVIDRGGRIISATSVQSGNSELTNPLVEYTIRDSGPFSMALLPHKVSIVPTDLVIVRRSFLERALLAAPATVALRSLGAWLGEFARLNGEIVAYEPLLRGIADRRSDLVGDDIGGLCRSVRAHRWFETGRMTPVVGMAGFAASRSIHGP